VRLLGPDAADQDRIGDAPQPGRVERELPQPDEEKAQGRVQRDREQDCALNTERFAT